MSGELFYGVDQRIVILVALALFLAALEIGFRLGRRRGVLSPTEWSQLTTVQAAMLGLLGLLLGFTFGMAQGRYDFRRQMTLEESVALGTTWARAQILPEPHRSAIADLLRRYVDARIAFYDTPGVVSDPKRTEAARTDTEALQTRLLDEARAVAVEDRRSVMTAIFLQSLNEAIDQEERRLVALESHVPEAILLMLAFVAAAALSLVGFGFGLCGRRHIAASTMAAVVIAAVMLLIVDLDRPQRGQVRIGQQSMLRLRETIRRATGQ